MRHQQETAEKSLRDLHRQQLQQLYEQQRHETEVIIKQHREELQMREERARAECQDYADRWDVCT